MNFPGGKAMRWVRPGSAHRPPGAWAEARKMAFPAEASDRLRGRDRDLKGQRSPGTVRILCGRVGTLNSWLPLSLRPGGMSLALRQPSRPAFPKMAVETLPCAARMALGESTFPRPHVTSRHLTSPRELSLLSLCERTAGVCFHGQAGTWFFSAWGFSTL